MILNTYGSEYFLKLVLGEEKQKEEQMKKLVIFIFLVLTTFFSLNLTKVSAATNVYEGTVYYETGWWLWENDWKADYYRSDTSYYTIATMKYMTQSHYWDGGQYSPDIWIAMEVGTSVSETESWEFSQTLGLEIPIYAAKAVAQMEISHSYEKTVTSYISTSQKVHLVAGYSPEGYYTFEARMNMDKYKVMTYDIESGTPVYEDTGYTFLYRANYPYFYCAYTTHQVN